MATWLLFISQDAVSVLVLRLFIPYGKISRDFENRKEIPFPSLLVCLLELETVLLTHRGKGMVNSPS